MFIHRRFSTVKPPESISKADNEETLKSEAPLRIIKENVAGMAFDEKGGA